MRKSYQPLLTRPLDIEVEGNVMVSSIVSDSLIESVGQDIGAYYDFCDTIENPDSFNHEWEGGLN